jgi:predicted transposase/invertase (TIGR01784 family)
VDKETHDHDMKDIAFTFIELPKYKKGKSEKLNNRIEQWCRYFKYGDDTTEKEAEEIVDPQIKEAYEAVNRFNWNAAELASYEAAEKRERDYRSQMSTAIEKGRVEGRVEGKAEEKLAIAVAMLEEGDSREKIARITGIPISEIKALDIK